MADARAIDVLIPVYNAESTIAEAVASIQRQSFGDFRIILVDDGSTDGTPAILDGIAGADARVEILRQPNGGIVSALNAGLAACTAPLVARHDADDNAGPDRFVIQRAYLDASPDCIAVGGRVRHIGSDGAPLGTVSEIGSFENVDPAAIPAIEPYLVHPFLMARREALVRIGGYRNAPHAEDADLYWRLQEIGRLHNLTDILGDYRVHEASISGGSIANGRAQALGSQLAALSAVRRRADKADLALGRPLAEYKAASGSLAALLALNEGALDGEERAHLALAVSAKLLELASYRPYELELEDCGFIHAALAEHGDRLPQEQRGRLRIACSGTAARLARQGLVREGWALVPPGMLPVTLARVAMRTVAPRSLRSLINRVRKRTLPMK